MYCLDLILFFFFFLFFVFVVFLVLFFFFFFVVVERSGLGFHYGCVGSERGKRGGGVCRVCVEVEVEE